MDGNKLATGVTTRRLVVPGNSTATFTLPMTADARQVVDNSWAETLGGFALGPADCNRRLKAPHHCRAPERRNSGHYH